MAENLEFPKIAKPVLEDMPVQGIKDGAKKKPKSGGFQSLGLGPAVFGGIIKLGYKIPTPIQRKTLPIALSGRDLVAMARTGSGKTAAFLIPVLERLGSHSSVYGARGIILSPTRELAQQTYKFAIKMGNQTSLRICLLQGGDKMDAQFEALANNPDILVATPGRLVHLLAEVKDFSLDHVEILVFDEADRLFEMGFAAQLNEIIRKCPEQRQTMLFSATMPKQLLEFTRAGLTNPELIRLDTDTKISENLKLAFFSVRSAEKIPALIHLLSEIIPEKDQTIVFVATRHHVEYLKEILKCAISLTCSIAYGSMDMESRKQNLQNFRNGRSRVLIVTDVAARGIDIPLLNNVINFDFPSKPKLFVHRVGRAARQGRPGAAFTFVTGDEVPYLIDLHLYLGRQIRTAVSQSVSYEKEEDDAKPIDTPNVQPKIHTLETMTPEDIYFGCFPQNALDFEAERLRRIGDEVAELKPMEKSIENAHSLYVKTRQQPSKRSISRAKEMEMPPIHPLLMDEDDIKGLMNEKAVNQTEKSNLIVHLNALKSFRPSQTVFEVEATKRGRTNAEGAAGAISAMQAKRSFHTEAISKAKSRKQEETLSIQNFSVGDQTTMLLEGSKTPLDGTDPNSSKRRLSKALRKKLKKGCPVNSTASGASCEDLETSETPHSYRDPMFYINAVPSEHDAIAEEHLAINMKNQIDENGALNRIEDSLLEIAPDEDAALAEKKRTYHWDKRKKKYVKATLDEHVKSKRMRNEAGAMINTKNRGEHYEKWQKKRKRRILGQGTAEEDAEEFVADNKTTNVSRISRSIRKKEYSEGKTGGRTDEINDEERLRKNLKEKERQKEKNMKGRKKMQKREANKETEERPRKRAKGQPGMSKYSRSRAVVKRGKGTSKPKTKGGRRR